MKRITAFLPRLWANWLTLFGAVLASIAGLALAALLFVEIFAPGRNAYAIGFAVIFLALVFVFGLAVIPVGLWWERRQKKTEKGTIETAFRTALEDRATRYRILFVAALTLVNVLILGVAGKSSIEYMDSPEFCGRACHQVMQPEWLAYQKSPHANVSCAECHIGASTSSYVKAKLNGVGQMIKLFTGSYHKPVPTPIEHMDSSVCVQCHSQRTLGDRIKLYPHYQQDQTNTPAFNALVMHVGGKDPKTTDSHGIHWHADPDIDVRYQYLDEKRAKIGTITVRKQGKVIATYLPPGAPGTVLGERRMDCVDCHNRPAHAFDPSAKEAIDRALYTGRLDARIPQLAKSAAELLLRPDGRRDDAEAFFRRALEDAYRTKNIPLTGEQATQTGKVLAEIYRLNVYPKLNLGWGTYRNLLSHEGDGGCFRCHDKQHTMKLPDGKEKVLSQDCDACHERLAADEDPKNFVETLKLLLPRVD